MERAPQAASQMLVALDFLLGPSPEVVLMVPAASEEPVASVCAVQTRFLGNRVIACRNQGRRPKDASSALEGLFAGKRAEARQAVMYVCTNGACQEPAVGPAAIDTALVEIAKPKEVIRGENR